MKKNYEVKKILGKLTGRFLNFHPPRHGGGATTINVGFYFGQNDIVINGH